MNMTQAEEAEVEGYGGVYHTLQHSYRLVSKTTANDGQCCRAGLTLSRRWMGALTVGRGRTGGFHRQELIHAIMSQNTIPGVELHNFLWHQVYTSTTLLTLSRTPLTVNSYIVALTYLLTYKHGWQWLSLFFYKFCITIYYP